MQHHEAIERSFLDKLQREIKLPVVLAEHGETGGFG